MIDLDIPEDLEFEVKNGRIRFAVEGLSTGWMNTDDSFVKRIDTDSLNPIFLRDHLKKEIRIKNTLDEGVRLLNSEKYPNAVKDFDEVLFYDPEYGEALLYKSYALRGQKHFVKALRHYRRAVKCDDCLKDAEYYRSLLKEANNERDNFPKIKLNIYAGDEYFAAGEFQKAAESYGHALANPSKFKERILSRLLNKKATALLELEDFENSLKCFEKSFEVDGNDYSSFGRGLCEFNLGLDVNDEFKGYLDISKGQMLRQVMILNEVGEYEGSLKINDVLFENHYRVDEFYLKLIAARRFSLDRLGEDLSEIDEIISEVSS